MRIRGISVVSPTSVGQPLSDDSAVGDGSAKGSFIYNSDIDVPSLAAL